MEDLILIERKQIGNEEINSVDARDLHSRLGVKKDFTAWIKYNIEKLNLIDGVDYLLTKKGEQLPSGTKYASSYILTLDAGKHIAMMTNTETAHSIRTYFIEFEKRAKTLIADTNPPLTPGLQLAHAVLLAGRMIEEQKSQIEQRDKFISVIQPKADALDRINTSDGLFGFRQVAKTLSVNENKLRTWLIMNDWIYYLGGRMTAKAPILRKGYADTKVKLIQIDGQDDKTIVDMFFTSKGLIKLTSVFGQNELIGVSP